MKRTLIIIGLLPGWLYPQSWQDSLTAELSAFAGPDAAIGFAVAILDRDEALYAKGFGYADIRNKIPYSVNTVQPIASISKTLIGVSLLKAQELGLLNLEDPINKYLPFEISNPFYPDLEITIRHLANHTSGLQDTKHYEKSYVFTEPILDLHKQIPAFPPGQTVKRLIFKRMIRQSKTNQEITLSDLIKNIYLPGGAWYVKNSSFLHKRPGEFYSYSNNGAAIASLVIEGASGMKYTDFVEAHILVPLEMQNSGWDMEDFEVEKRSKLYPFSMEIPYYKLITLADGGFITSVSDFSKYLAAAIRGCQGEDNILSSESYQLMFNKESGYNQGIFWSLHENRIGHSGGDPGIRTIAYFDKQNGLGYICFMNTDTNPPDALVRILRILVKYSERMMEDDSPFVSEKGQM